MFYLKIRNTKTAQNMKIYSNTKADLQIKIYKYLKQTQHIIIKLWIKMRQIYIDFKVDLIMVHLLTIQIITYDKII